MGSITFGVDGNRLQTDFDVLMTARKCHLLGLNSKYTKIDQNTVQRIVQVYSFALTITGQCKAGNT